MFRQVKKKPKSMRSRTSETTAETNARRTEDDQDGSSDDGEEATTIIRNRHSKHKSRNRISKSNTAKQSSGSSEKRAERSQPISLSTSSFVQDEEEGEDEIVFRSTATSKQRKRKRKGFGFGGMAATEDGSAAGELPDQAQSRTDNGSTSRPSTGSLYGKEALAQLKAEQALAPKPEPGLQSKSQPTKEVPSDDGLGKDPDPAEVLAAQDFIYTPYDSADGPWEHISNEPEPSKDMRNDPTLLEETEESSKWEAQIAKRAGISAQPPPAPIQDLPSLQTLRENLQSTVEHLKAREQDLLNSKMRREADMAQAKADKERQGKLVEEAGKACAEYQTLRYNLAMWVGALRDLDSKVAPIFDRLVEMVESHLIVAEETWKLWQDDACAILHQTNLLKEVLGRPQSLSDETKDSDVQLDEFGRDIGSQQRRDRDARYHRRIQRQQEVERRYAGTEAGQPDPDLTLDYLWTLEDDAKERYTVLQEALRVALDDLDEEYASVDRLLSIFQPWKAKFADEYRQSYANVSLAELVFVFDRVQFCKMAWLRSLWSPGEDLVKIDGESDLFENLLSTLAFHEGSAEYQSTLQRPLEKHFLSFLRQIFQMAPCSILLSTRISTALGSPTLDVCQRLKGTEFIDDVCDILSKALAKTIQSISIPLIQSKVEGASDRDDQEMAAIQYTTVTQLKWIQKLFVNLLVFWTPSIRGARAVEEFNKELLGFLGGNFLILLSSQQTPEVKEIFAPIWTALRENNHDLLQSSVYLLHSAPIRAAAQAYGL